MDEDKYRESVKAALDNAIAEVAREEYERLSDYLYPIATPIEITEYAFEELEKLQKGLIPSYDEWVAPFYLTWYQPGQINIAYSMIADLMNERNVLTDTGKLHVVDFGCGALAMQFGVALAAADAIRKGQKIDEIFIDSIDSSTDMINIGKKL